MNMIKMLNKIIGILKNDKNYTLDDTYSLKQLLYIVFYRAIQIVNGLIIKIKINSQGIIFCGSHVKIQYGFLIKAGKSLILEDGVVLNAISENGIILGRNVTIAKYSILQCTGVIAHKGVGIKIGNNSAIGAHSYLGGQGGIEIGNDVIMGPGVKIFSENHNFENTDVLIRKQGESRDKVKINDNCWIGANAIILAGVEIGYGCVIAAGSVVTKSLPDNNIAAGVPAKILKQRCLENKKC
jgi:acetyltransferase-like isoleucine patch superfamily enzyme